MPQAMTVRALLIAAVLAAAPGCGPAEQGAAAGKGGREAVTFESLLAELGDRDRLAVFPEGAWTQHQASSHDPRNATGFSRFGRPWGYANVDFGNYLRRESTEGREEWVLLEEPGPGALTRWWAVGIDDDLLAKGRFRVYVDGSETPVLEATALDLVGRDASGFGPSLNFGTPERGGNLYAPIPYRSGIKVTWDGPTTHGGKDVAGRDPALGHSADSALWYNLNFRRFESDAEVASFTRSTAAEAGEALERANRHLSRPAVTDAAPEPLSAEERLEAGGVIRHRLEGPAAIRRLRVSVFGEDPVAAIHGATLVLIFDGQETARLPVAQFFGNGESESRENPWNEGGDYMRSIDASGDMTSYWVMPFRDAAEVQVVNESGQVASVSLDVDAGDWAWDERSMHFHADYRSETGIRTRSAGDAAWPGVAGKRELYSAEGDADFRFIDIRGRGVYVGDTLSIRNRSTGPGLNAWWGEGDEKIYVDYLDAQGHGSTATPDHRGTGTEDYYGYSFGSGKEFTSPFVTQPIAAGNRTDDGALTVNGRVRGLDAIPFQESLKFDMELWKWREGELDVGAATFWYGVPGAVSLSVVADLAVDLAAATAGAPSSDAGVADTAGDGRWHLLAAHEDSLHRSGMGYHEIQLQPAAGDTEETKAVARWVAGASSRGSINVSGVVRNLIAKGDGPDFHILVNGVRVFEAPAAESGDGTLAETYFDFDTRIEPGQRVDFVLGNGGAGDAVGDESALRAIIRARSRNE